MRIGIDQRFVREASVMIRLRLRAVGAGFDADDEGSDYLSSDEAERAAVKAGIAIAADEIGGRNKSSIVEAQVLDGEKIVGRIIVALSVEALPAS